MQSLRPHAAPPIPGFSEAQKSLIDELLADDRRAIDAVLCEGDSVAQRNTKPAFSDAQKTGNLDISDTQKRDLRTALLAIDRATVALSNIAHDLATLRASLVVALLRCNEAGKVDNAVINITSDTTRQPATGPARIEEA